MRILGFITLALLLNGCSSLMNMIPDRFDNVEYAKLVSLNVDAEVSKESCSVDIETYKSALFLKKYSEGTMNKTNNEIYSEIHWWQNCTIEKIHHWSIVNSNGKM